MCPLKVELESSLLNLAYLKILLKQMCGNASLVIFCVLYFVVVFVCFIDQRLNFNLLHNQW